MPVQTTNPAQSQVSIHRQACRSPQTCSRGQRNRWNNVPPRKARATELIAGADFPCGVPHAALLLQVEHNRVEFVGIDGSWNQGSDDFELAIADLDNVDVADRVIGGFQLLDQ